MRRLAPWILCTALRPLAVQAGERPPPPLVVLAPHPDDAEASCGGLVANAVAAGEEVVIVSLTGGELGVAGKSPAEARALRAEEARRAAAVLGARLEELGALDGSLVADAATAGKLLELLLRLRPRAVLAPWPLDVHPDHQAAGLLAWRTFHDRRAAFELFFYETANGPHTTSFRFQPTDWVDVTGAVEKKREATLQHASQRPADWVGMYLDLARVRGFEADVPYAEGYVRARASSGLGGRRAETPRTLALAARREDAPEPATRPEPPPRRDATVASDWAGLDRYREENARLAPPAQAEKRVVFFGDSITEGWVRTVPGFFAGRPFVGRGISGQTTAQMLLRFRQDVLALRPRAVVILAGTNDIAGNAGPYREEDTLGNLRSMAELARAQGVRVVLASLLPARDYPWRPEQEPAPRIAALNARLRDYARESGAVWLDYHAAMADAAGGLRLELGSDGVHPDRAGYEIMGRLAERALRRALAAR